MSSTEKQIAMQKSNFIAWSATGLLAVIVVATYWSALKELVFRWYTDPDYIHGFLVPIFSGVLLWYRRGILQEEGSRERGAGSREQRAGGAPAQRVGERGAKSEERRADDPASSRFPAHLSPVLLSPALTGLVLIAVAGAMRIISSYCYYTLLDPASLIPCLAGLTLFVGGWKALRWAWPAIIFLIFMVPLPGFLASLAGQPLQRLATAASTFLIQTIGISAVAEGNVISLANSQIGVAEACNGLRNMMLFLAVCVGLVFISRRSLPEKVIIVLSSAVIALLANIVRIASTAVLHQFASDHTAATFYHDLAGCFMMPLAVVFLWMELAYLNHVFVKPTTSDG
jgi:exosortase